MSRKRIVVTGATGLIGRQTIEPLKALDFEVIALSRGDRAVAGTDETIAVDILSPDGLDTVFGNVSASHLMHLAWHDNPADRWSSPVNLDWVAATLHLVRAFAKSGGQRVIAAGSCAEYDWRGGEELSETSRLAPASLYGAAKAATGNLLCAAAQPLGLTLAWARIFFCYGPGEPRGRLVGDLISGLHSGKPVDCTDGKQKRDFLHTADIGRALALIADSTQNGPVNVASGKAVAVREIIETTARQLGRADLIRLGALPRPENDPPCVKADVSRLGELGFEPGFNLETGLADTIANWART